MRSLAARVTPAVSAQAISKYEAGKMMPSSGVLIGLGTALDVSLDFLLSSEVEALDGLEFPKRSGTSARDRAKAEAIVIDNLERYLAIEDILDIEPDLGWIEGLRCESVASEPDIDNMADQLRRRWNLGMGPIPSMCALLEQKGIKVVEDDLPERISGLACHALRGGKPVADAAVVSSRTNVERKRFNLAHELARRIILSTGNAAIKLESAMNRFAGAFLVPRESLIEETGPRRNRFTYEEIIRLKHIYGVTAAAMLVRLGQVGILPATAVRYAFTTFARPWRRSEPEPICGDSGFAAFEKPRRFEQLVWRAIGEDMISPVRAAELLNQSRRTIEQRILGPLAQ